ncbi:MAG: 50S ribosomal protein L18e [archaeon]|jgi:large subunit ribosomal protein L18e
MPKKLETKLLVAELEKKSRKDGKKLWNDLAERLGKPRRGKITVNVGKIDSIAKKSKGKTIIVPGKVLGKGELEEKVTVVAVEASEEAVKKINAKGEFILLKDFVEKGEAKNTLIVG